MVKNSNNDPNMRHLTDTQTGKKDINLKTAFDAWFAKTSGGGNFVTVVFDENGNLVGVPTSAVFPDGRRRQGGGLK
ncbi:MAG: hypothetical protein LBC56_00420 [Oscillospiraceae bacterium]|jgi:hypothetical protein|nr:hypothetical protein [Oscillospiraceae bacterium]